MGRSWPPEGKGEPEAARGTGGSAPATDSWLLRAPLGCAAHAPTVQCLKLTEAECAGGSEQTSWAQGLTQPKAVGSLHVPGVNAMLCDVLLPAALLRTPERADSTARGSGALLGTRPGRRCQRRKWGCLRAGAV